MNNQIQQFARNTLKEGLAQLSEDQQRLFKRMYSHRDLEKTINAIVDSMPANQLDWAMQQVQNSLDKRKKLMEPVEEKTNA